MTNGRDDDHDRPEDDRDGEPRDRIAASLGVTLNNVTVRLHRGRQALKKRLDQMCLTCPVHGFLDCRCDEAERIRQLRAGAPG